MNTRPWLDDKLWLMKQFLLAFIVLFCSRIDMLQAKVTLVEPVVGTSASVMKRVATFRQLGVDYDMTLRGEQASTGVSFGVRNDEIVEVASLHLRYRYSSKLIAGQSRIKVALNGVEIATLPVVVGQGGRLLSSDIVIDPRLVAGYNRINLQLDGHYLSACEDPDYVGLWAKIDTASSVSLTTKPVLLINDLSLLPVPFFDSHDPRRLELPFVLPSRTDMATLKAAGILSSWFGMLAGYRGALFPVSTSLLPEAGNAVVLATADAIPKELVLTATGLKTIIGPTLAVVANPNDPNGKLLLVLGRNARDLQDAATELALHRPPAGAAARLQQVGLPAPRKPYDAPKWIPSSRKVRFGELVDDPRTLNVSGYHPDLIRIGLQLPPDLFLWNAGGIPIDLKYGYSVPATGHRSVLNIGINNVHVSTLPLRPRDRTYWLPMHWFGSTMGEDHRILVERQLDLPISSFSGGSQLYFNFIFNRPRLEECARVYPDVSGGIDANSSIDLSRFYHYMAMPDLAAFTNAGFPFTRLADLAESTIVLPNNAGSDDFSTVLNLLGHLGASTGYPALRVKLSTPDEVERYADSDLLVFGSVDSQPLFAKWYDRLPITQDHSARRLGALIGSISSKLLSFLWVETKRTDLASTADVSLHREPDDVLLMGFQSPLVAGRSVVALMSGSPLGMRRMFDAWSEPALLKDFQGGVVVLQGKKVISLTSSQGYHVGHLPWLTWLRWYLGNHPVLLALMVLVLCVLLALAARLRLRLHTAYRLRQGRRK